MTESYLDLFVQCFIKRLKMIVNVATCRLLNSHTAACTLTIRVPFISSGMAHPATIYGISVIFTVYFL